MRPAPNLKTVEGIRKVSGPPGKWTLVSKQQWDIKSPEIFICQLSGGLTFR